MVCQVIACKKMRNIFENFIDILKGVESKVVFQVNAPATEKISIRERVKEQSADKPISGKWLTMKIGDVLLFIGDPVIPMRILSIKGDVARCESRGTEREVEINIKEYRKYAPYVIERGYSVFLIQGGFYLEGCKKDLILLT